MGIGRLNLNCVVPWFCEVMRYRKDRVRVKSKIGRRAVAPGNVQLIWWCATLEIQLPGKTLLDWKRLKTKAAR